MIEYNIITSMLDNDWYKFTMAQAIYENFGNIKVTYKFHNRGEQKFTFEMYTEIIKQVQKLNSFLITDEEFKFMKPYFNKNFLGWLYNYRHNPENVHISLINGNLNIYIKGLWLETVLLETPILAIISEVYYHYTLQNVDYKNAKPFSRRKLSYKLKYFDFDFIEFGTRRRFSRDLQEQLFADIINKKIDRGIENGTIKGTSNALISSMFEYVPLGTYAHEVISAMGAFYGIEKANEKWLEIWSKLYKEKYQIMLTDTYTTDYFIKTVNPIWWKNTSGVRIDSGDPEKIGMKIIEQYKKLKIDPKTKTLVFSDGLTFKKAHELNKIFKPITNPVFGIGTNFTSDVGLPPLNIVIKLNSVFLNGIEIPTIKLSDSEGKYTGDKKAIEEALNKINYEKNV